MRLSNQALDDDTPTASASGLGGRMHFARRPAPLLRQGLDIAVADIGITRRLVREAVRMAKSVGVDVAELAVDPGIAGAGRAGLRRQRDTRGSWQMMPQPARTASPARAPMPGPQYGYP